MKTSLAMVFGDCDTTNLEESREFDSAFDLTSEIAAKRGRLGLLFKILYYKQNQAYVKACYQIHDYLDKLVARAVQNRSSQVGGKEKRRHCLLDELLQVTSDLEQIRWEILSLLAAGRDTSSTLLTHAIHNLVRRPDVWAKCLEEVRELNGEAPDFETLQKMRYLKWVINESRSTTPF
jgi:cytochrome P450